MGLGLVIGDVFLQVLVSYSVEVLDEAVRVELRWFELVVDDFSGSTRTVGCAGAGNGISDTSGSLTFSGFVTGEMKICLSFIRFGVMGLIKRLFLNVILFDPSKQIWYWRCGRISTTISALTQRRYPFKFGSWMATVVPIGASRS